MLTKFVLFVFISIDLSLIISAVNFSNTQDYDAYGTRLVSTNDFVVFAQNDGSRYMISMAPFGSDYMCIYDYEPSNNFVISIATSRKQNSSQLSFVYLLTNSTDGYYQKLGLFTFSREQSGRSSNGSCMKQPGPNDGAHEAVVWHQQPSEMAALQVDLDVKYAYGFLSKMIFIYNIKNNSVVNLSLTDVFESIEFCVKALDISKTDNGISMAVVAGYYIIDVGKTLPIVYLIQLNPPYSMTIVSNYTIISDSQKFVRGNYASTYQFNYVMSVCIHDSTQQVLVAVPQLRQVLLFSFNSTTLTYIKQFDHPARSVAWLDAAGIQAGFLLNSVTTLPWAQSRVEIVNISSNEILYVYPNNQQTLEQWSNTPPTFIRLITSYDHQLIILTSDGIVILVPSTDAGYYSKTDDITSPKMNPKICPSGTYKNIRGTMPCTICPSMTRSSSDNMNISNSAVNCTMCSTSSFCPLGSIKDINSSFLQSLSQAYAYPISSSGTSIDDILMQNTFTLPSKPIRCLLISPFFWSLIILIFVFILVLIMTFLKKTHGGKKNYQRIKTVFQHSDLITNGEFWFGGAVSFSVIVLIIYSFWFGLVFIYKYPIETSTDATFACDESLRNTQFSSTLQLLSTIKSDEQRPTFELLDKQQFTMTIHFLQTGFTCQSIATQENIGTYSVSLTMTNCTNDTDNARVIAIYRLPSHSINMQINLTGLYFIGGLVICLNGPESTYDNSSSYIVRELNYCESFSSENQTLSQTTYIDFILTKVINRTEFLDYSGSINSSAIWIPTSSHGSLDDHVMYNQEGKFQRYLSTQYTVIIRFDETEFYVINRQEPIVRLGEVIFHNVIFTTTIIGLFALVFLIFKLVCMPLFKILIENQAILLEICRLKRKQARENDHIL